MIGFMEGPCRNFILLYNDQPQVFDLPEKDAVRFAALEVLCELLRFLFSFLAHSRVVVSIPSYFPSSHERLPEYSLTDI